MSINKIVYSKLLNVQSGSSILYGILTQDEQKIQRRYSTRDSLISKVTEKVPRSAGKKVTIVGAGAVGMTAAFAILSKNISDEICIVDPDENRICAERRDLEQGGIYLNDAKVSASSDYAESANSNVCIITAGVRGKPGQTRLDMLLRNADLFKDIVPKLVEHSPKAKLVVIGNPCDVMTYLSWKLSGFPKNRVLGTGTSLDSARFRFFISQRLGIAPSSVHALVIGEHGDSSLPVWSNVNVAGVRLAELHPQIGCKEDEENWNVLHTDVVKAAFNIIKLKGYTSWAIGLVAASVTSAIMQNTNQVLPVSTSACKTVQPAPSASPSALTSPVSSVASRDEIYIDDEGIEGSGGRGEIHDDLEKDPDYSGSGFGPDDEDSSTIHDHRQPSFGKNSGKSQNSNDNDFITSRTTNSNSNSGTIIGSSGNSGSSTGIIGSSNTGINSIGKELDHHDHEHEVQQPPQPPQNNNNNFNNHASTQQHNILTTTISSSSFNPSQIPNINRTHVIPSPTIPRDHNDDDDDFDLGETNGGGGGISSSGDGPTDDENDDDDTGDDDIDDDIISHIPKHHEGNTDAANTADNGDDEDSDDIGGGRTDIDDDIKHHIDPYHRTNFDLEGGIKPHDDLDLNVDNDNVDDHNDNNDDDDDDGDDDSTDVYTDPSDGGIGTHKRPGTNQGTIHELDSTNVNSLPTDTKVEHTTGNEVLIMNTSDDDRTTSFFAQPGILAAVIGGAVVGLLCAILVVMFIVYRMRKKDEGSYALDEPKRSPAVNSYAKNANNREFYA